MTAPSSQSSSDRYQSSVYRKQLTGDELRSLAGEQHQDRREIESGIPKLAAQHRLAFNVDAVAIALALALAALVRFNVIHYIGW